MWVALATCGGRVRVGPWRVQPVLDGVTRFGALMADEMTSLPALDRATPMGAGARDAYRRAILAWYDACARALPWRVTPSQWAAGARPDPYTVWLSEIMLQQTTVAAATPYFERFVAAFPRIDDLAAAPLDDVLSLWSGLGYYRRARNLHACAQIVAERGAFPNTERELRSLPGIGDYTAAAIAAVCFGAPATVVDGNVERVMARLFAVDTPLPKAKRELRALAGRFTDADRSGDYAQAVMDLGARICRPRSPNCGACPWRTGCAAHADGAVERFPVRAAKRTKPQRFGAGFVLVHEGAVLLRRRDDSGVLAGMAEPPGTPWRDEIWGDRAALAYAPLRADWARSPDGVTHVFTHFGLDVAVWCAEAKDWTDPDAMAPEGHWWARLDGLDRQALPSVMRKIIDCGLEALRAADG